MPWVLSLLGAAVIDCAHPLPPPAPTAASASSAPPEPPAPSASAPPAPALVELRWEVEPDFAQSAAGRLEAQPLDVPAVARALPAASGRAFADLIARSKEEGRKDEASALAEKLEAQAARSPASALAAGALIEQWRIPDKKQTPWPARALAAYARGASAPVSDPMAAQARYRRALLQQRLQRDDRGKAMLDELASSTSDLRPEAAARLSSLVGEGRDGAPDKAIEALRKGLDSQIPASAAVRGALIHGMMLSHYRMHKHAAALTEAIDYLRGFRGAGPPSIPAEAAMRVAADCLEHLGVDELLARPAPPAVAEVLLRVAWRAVRREQFALAERVGDHVLSSDPLGFQAPAALRILISAADGAAQPVAAEERRARLTREFGPTSPWAAAQRAARGPDGWPSDAVLAASARAPKPLEPEPPAARVEARAKALARLCLEPHAFRELPPSGLSLLLDVAVAPDGAATVKASLDPPSPAFDEAARCAERLGPEHFKKAPASLKARATWAR